MLGLLSPAPAVRTAPYHARAAGRDSTVSRGGCACPMSDTGTVSRELALLIGAPRQLWNQECSEQAWLVWVLLLSGKVTHLNFLNLLNMGLYHGPVLDQLYTSSSRGSQNRAEMWVQGEESSFPKQCKERAGIVAEKVLAASKVICREKFQINACWHAL